MIMSGIWDDLLKCTLDFNSTLYHNFAFNKTTHTHTHKHTHSQTHTHKHTHTQTHTHTHGEIKIERKT